MQNKFRIFYWLLWQPRTKVKKVSNFLFTSRFFKNLKNVVQKILELFLFLFKFFFRHSFEILSGKLMEN